MKTAASLNSKIDSICDIMRRSNAAGALQYVPELTWMLFLRILDEREEMEAMEAEAIGIHFTPSLAYPYRWSDWAAPGGQKRKELQNGMSGAMLGFVNEELIPHLHDLKDGANATPKQKVISEIMSGTSKTRLDTERNLLDTLDRVHDIRDAAIDDTHVFTLPQAYESLLLKMGEKNNDGGQFFTPREVIRAIMKVVDPSVDETVFDPACGTGGFLAEARESMLNKLGEDAIGESLETLNQKTFYGKEKDEIVYPIALANLVLHGIEKPNIWHGNTLTRNESYGGLFEDAPDLFDVILMNPPFGGSEGPDAQTRYAYKTSSTQVLFLQEIIDSLKPGGRAGIVVDEGLMFRTNERAFVQTKRKLLDECDLYCVVSLPGGVFTQAGAGVKTNLLFFNKAGRTENTWYYDLSHLKVNKGNPLTLSHFDEFFKLLPTRSGSENSWTVERQAIEAAHYDLKAVNPNRIDEGDTRTTQELLEIIELKGREIREALAGLGEA